MSNEPSDNDKQRFVDNLWEENLDEVMSFVKEAIKDPFEGWQWINNSRCKYVDIRIDMRDGGFIIKDRDGKRISFDQLKHQYKGET